MSYYPDFARLLTEALEDQDRTPTWLAHRIGISPSTINRWLNHGARPGNADTITQIADVLGLTDQRQALLIAAGYGYQESTPHNAPQILDPIPPRNSTTERPQHSAVSPFLVPALPPHGVVGRDQILAQITNLLAIDDEQPADIPPIALQGMGGIGKTTLAVSLARLSFIHDTFPDGVLWTSVGPEPTIRNLLEDWGRALGITMFSERNEAACSDRLRGVLHDRRALLIIDDIWETHHGRYFTIAGPYCRTVFTTRESPVAHSLATRERTIKVDVLSPNSALRLLASLASKAVTSDEESAKQLCERLEYLPLALTLAGRLLANETDVPSRMKRLFSELLEQRDARLRLLQIDGRLGLSETEPVSLQAILGMSVNRLDSVDQARFAMLSVFGGEPLTWDLPAATYVWDCSVEQAEMTISNFIQRGLIMHVGEQYWMHALLADYASELLEKGYE